MLGCLLAATCALAPPSCSTQDLVATARSPSCVGRRSVLGAGVGLGLAALRPLPAAAKAKRADEYEPVAKNTDKYASGFVRKRTPVQLRQELLDNVFTPYQTAYNKKDYSALTKLFTADAKIVDGTDKKSPLVTASGAEYGSYISERVPYTDARLVPVSIVPEYDYDGVILKAVHVQYDLIHNNGFFRCYRRIVETPEGWKTDRELLPLDSARAYAKLSPKRDVFGHVYMQLS